MWLIKENGFDKEHIIHRGNQFLIGHMKLGVRGTLDEFKSAEMAAITLPFVYDQVGDGWREPVNAFNPLFTEVIIDGKPLNVLNGKVITHEQILDMKNAVMSRRSVIERDSYQVTIESSRFVSSVDERVIISKFQVSVDKDIKIVIKTGIDIDIWDINGKHIEDVKLSEKGYLKVEGVTHEKGHRITCLKEITPLFENSKVRIEKNDDGIFYVIEIDAKKNHVYKFESYAVIGVDQENDDLEILLSEVLYEGYHKRLEKHSQIWNQKWDISNVIIKGDEKADLALRYSIYHLLLLAPQSDYQSIPARGISGQTYKGAVFWDTEIFMLPFYLNTDLVSAKRIILYRIQGLPGAKLKAKSYGFNGAFYAWESQENGYDACTDYNVTDVFTKRLIRTYFKDKQVHISGDIVYAMKMYIDRTSDYCILKDGALEVILEVARFYLDYGHYSILKNRFEIWDVMGPDEYHERVHNNAFTNQLVKMVFELVLEYEKYFKNENDQYFNEMVEKLNYHHELESIKKYKDLVYIKEIEDNRVIEQFDGYFNHKDIHKEELLKLKLHEHEYLGGQGLAGDTQIIKQADVITMLYLFKEKYSLDVIQKNWEYYEPRTEHGSTLSASMYALTSCLINNPNDAYPLFMKSATVDLTGKSKHFAGGIYIGGTHPAASGGAYMTAIFGFSGLSFNQCIKVNPKLPKSFESISYTVRDKGKLYKININKNESKIMEEIIND